MRIAFLRKLEKNVYIKRCRDTLPFLLFINTVSFFHLQNQHTFSVQNPHSSPTMVNTHSLVALVAVVAMALVANVDAAPAVPAVPTDGTHFIA
jgi:hypothetical protein